MANTRATLTFLGAAGTVTGSKYLLTFGDRRVLVDCGIFQGEKEWRLRNWDEFPVPPASISDLVVTHAHLDHVGMIPALVKGGFDGPIWMTEGTRGLAEIVLRDSAHLQEQEARDANEGGYSKHEPALPLYTTEDVEASLPLMRIVPFDTPVDLGGGLSAEWARAGHILASASVRLTYADAAVLFSGDLGRHDHPVLKERDTTPPAAPFVVMESTYGDREHPEPEGEPHEKMAEAIRSTIKRGGSVLIPAFNLVYGELLGPWGQSFARKEVCKPGAGSCSFQALATRFAGAGELLVQLARRDERLGGARGEARRTAPAALAHGLVSGQERAGHQRAQEHVRAEAGDDQAAVLAHEAEPRAHRPGALEHGA